MSSQDACFGVQVTLIRGCAAIQARVALEVCDDPLSMTMWMLRCGAMHWSRRCRKPVKVTELLRVIGSVITCPVAICSAATMETVPLRMYSNSRRASWPRRGGRSGYLRYLAWIPVFSSMQITTVPGGGRR